jgi:hypothetical protein
MNQVSLRLLLSLAVNRKYKIFHLDISTAFLNSPINEEIYVEQPPGFNGDRDKVWLLLKSIYGLRSSPANWYKTVSERLLSIDFKISDVDECVFYKKTDEKIIMIGIHVDDFVIVCKDEEDYEMFKQQLNMKHTDNGIISSFLNMQFQYDEAKGLLKMNQSEYIRDMLNNFQMTNANSKKTPIVPGEKWMVVLYWTTYRYINR